MVSALGYSRVATSRNMAMHGVDVRYIANATHMIVATAGIWRDPSRKSASSSAA